MSTYLHRTTLVKSQALTKMILVGTRKSDVYYNDHITHILNELISYNDLITCQA